MPDGQEECEKQNSQQQRELVSKVKRIPGSHLCQKSHKLKRAWLRKSQVDLLMTKTIVKICWGSHSARGCGVEVMHKQKLEFR